MTIWMGENYQLRATILPNEAFNPDTLDWRFEPITTNGFSLYPSPENPAIAILSAYSVGSARIIVQVKGHEELADTCIVTSQYRGSGQCGDHLYWTLDGKYSLNFWVNNIGESRTGGDYNHYDMWDYSATNPAPWHDHADSISNVELYNVNAIGKNAFRDMQRLCILQLQEGNELRDSVLWGCSNLKVIIEDDSCVTPVTATSLKTSETSEIRGVVVRSENSHSGLTEAFKADPVWSAAGRVITPGDGEWNKLRWSLFQSDSLSALHLQVEPGWGIDKGYRIPDVDTTIVSNRAPWHEWRDLVADITIGMAIRYIGSQAFSSLTNLQTIRFCNPQENDIIDTIHYDAFNHSIHPWKFAFADGDRSWGPTIPPVIRAMGANPTNYDEAGAVLYVRDSTLRVTQQLKDRFNIPDEQIVNDSIRAVQLYALAPYWSSFNRITDYTVTVSGITSSSAQLQWLPIEGAVSYRLWIGKDGCATCDTTIDIPALGGKGLVDWTHITIPSYIAPRRVQQSDDGSGTLVLTITIKAGSGQTANKDVSVQAAGLAPNTTYHFNRTARSEYGEMPAMTQFGSFTTLATDATALPEVPSTNTSSGRPGVYDMMGRRVADHVGSLPAGVYIIDNGQTRTTCILMP